jgi:filamentous hemagglutinin family protein
MYNIRFSIARSKLQFAALLLATVVMPFPLWAQSAPAPTQLPTGGQVSAGQAAINQNGASMNIDQGTNRAAINWQSFDIGKDAHVHFNQPSRNSATLNRVNGVSPSQIFGKMTANGQVFLTNAAGVYFAPGATVNVGGLTATTHNISDDAFMAGRGRFTRDGAEGAVVNEGEITADLGGYVALLAPEVRNEGIIVAQMGTVTLSAGEAYELKFNGQGGLTDITVTPASMKAIVENKQAVRAPGGLVILSAQAVNRLQGGVVKNTGTIEASGLVNDGGTVRLVASGAVELGGVVNVDAAANSKGHGGKVTAIASLDDPGSTINFSGAVSARGSVDSEDGGGDGGFVETSASAVEIGQGARVDTSAEKGKTGDWLIDPYDYTINGAAATAIQNSLSTSNVEVTTTVNDASQGSNGNASSPGNITVSSGITSASANKLTLTADNSIAVSAAIDVGALTLTGPGGITLNNDLTTLTDMTLNGNVTLGADVTLTSGVSNTYTAYTAYTVPGGVSSLTATLVGGAGGKGGDDGPHVGGIGGSVGILTASFDVTGGQTVYVAPGSGGGVGVSSATSAAGGAGGTNNFNLGNGGAGGIAGPSGSSGGGGGGGAATVLALSNTPNSASQMLIAGGGGGGGGSGNNDTCPSICNDQASANYRNDNNMAGQIGYNATNQFPATAGQDGGASGGGGGGVVGGVSNISVFNTNEWTGRGGNVGQSGAANGFATDSLSTSIQNIGNAQNGYAIISYGGGLIDINGTINGAHNLNIVARSSDVDISGAIGGGAALASLSVIGSQGIGLSGGAVTTTGAQAYTGPLSLNANNNAFTTTSNGAVTFAGSLLKGSGVNSNVNVSSGSGAVAFNGQTGSSGTPIGAMSVTTTGNTMLGGALYATSFAKAGSGKTTVSGGIVSTTGSQSYAGELELGGNTTLNSTGAGDITLSGAVSNSTQSNLTIDAAGGNVSLLGNLAVGTNARPTPIGDVAITASGAVTLGSPGTPLLADAKSLSVTANAATIHSSASTTSNTTCNNNASAAGMCFVNSVVFNTAVASTINGPFSGLASFTKSGVGKLILTGDNTYAGNTTVNAGVMEIGGTGRLGGGNYAGDINVTGQLRFNNSVAQTLGGVLSGTGFINSPGSGTTQITTLANADHYNLIDAYVVPTSSVSGGSSLYGSAPAFGYQLATTAAGGTAFTDGDPSGTATINGAPTNTSNVGNYTVTYAGGLAFGNERYIVNTGNDLAWSVVARPLTVTVSKVYDGSGLFSSGFALSNIVNGDATPALTGTASASSDDVGSYNSFASSTLSQNNSNYTLTGAAINAIISPKPLDVTVSKTYDGTALFSRGFLLAGMIGADIAPSVSGSASTPSMSAGTYTSFASNNLILSDANYTLSGGNVSATISPQPPVPPVTSITPPPPITTPPGQTQNPLPPELTLPGDAGPVIANTASNITTASAADTSSTTSAPESSSSSSASAEASTEDMANPAVTATTESGIVVSLVREPSAQIEGVINVIVPKDIAAKPGGFSFPLPEQIVIGSSQPVITTINGGPLPGWLTFNPETKTFTATSVPVGGLPIHIVIKTDGMETAIVISEGA